MCVLCCVCLVLLWHSFLSHAMSGRGSEASVGSSELSPKESRQSITSAVDDCVSSYSCPRSTASGDHVGGVGELGGNSWTGRVGSVDRVRSLVDTRGLQTTKVVGARSVSHPSFGAGISSQTKAEAAAAEPWRTDVVSKSTSTTDCKVRVCDDKPTPDYSRHDHPSNEQGQEAERDGREQTLDSRRQNSQPTSSVEPRLIVNDAKESVLVKHFRSANSECPTRPLLDFPDSLTDTARSKSAQLLSASISPPPAIATTSKPTTRKIANTNLDDKSAAQHRTASSTSLSRKDSYVIEPDCSGNSDRNERLEMSEPEIYQWLDDEIGVDELSGELGQAAFTTSNNFDDDDNDDEKEFNTEKVLMQLKQLACSMNQKPLQPDKEKNGRKTGVVQKDVRPGSQASVQLLKQSYSSLTVPLKRASSSVDAGISGMPVLVPSFSSVIQDDDFLDDVLPATPTFDQLSEQSSSTARTKRSSAGASRSRMPVPVFHSLSLLHQDDTWDDIQSDSATLSQLSEPPPSEQRARHVSTRGASRSHAPVSVASNFSIAPVRGSSSTLYQDDEWDDKMRLPEQPPLTTRTKSRSGSKSRTPVPARSSLSLLHEDEVCDEVTWDDVPSDLPNETHSKAQTKRASARASDSDSSTASSSACLQQDDDSEDEVEPMPAGAAAFVELPEQTPSEERIENISSFSRTRSPVRASSPSSRLQRGAVVAGRSSPVPRGKTYAKPTISVNAKQTGAGPVFTWNRPSAAKNVKNPTTNTPSTAGRGISNKPRVDKRQPTNASKGSGPAAAKPEKTKTGNRVKGSSQPAATAASQKQPTTGIRQTKSADTKSATAERANTPSDNCWTRRRLSKGVPPSEVEPNPSSEQPITSTRQTKSTATRLITAEKQDNCWSRRRRVNASESTNAGTNRPSEQLSRLAARLQNHRDDAEVPGDSGEQTVEDVYVDAMSLDTEGRVSGQSSVEWRQELSRIIDSLRHQLRSRKPARTTDELPINFLTADDITEAQRISDR